MKPIYLDYNATTPIAKEVADAMVPFLYGGFGNPSSSHVFGIEAKQAVERARASVARMIGADPDEIIFTSGGSEANNLAIKGTALALRDKGTHIITSRIEHPAVLEVCAWLETQGFQTTYLPVDSEGLVDPGDLERALRSSTILVTLMLANNEIGTLEPIQDIARICRTRGVRIHTDAAQAIGKIPVNVQELGVDLLSIAGHKLYAPKGIGALYVRRGTSLARLIHGAGHERGLRAGTENVLEIVGLGKAAELVSLHLEEYRNHMKELRDDLETRILEGSRERGVELRINARGAPRLPNTSSISFYGIDAATILAELEGVAASAGAACHADRVEVSHVIAALQVPEEFARGTIRFSVGRETTKEEIRLAATRVVEVVSRLAPLKEPVLAAESKSEETGGPVRLTRYTRGLGCACKLPVRQLQEVLHVLPRPKDPAVRVGMDTSDDAAVYSLAKVIREWQERKKEAENERQQPAFFNGFTAAQEFSHQLVWEEPTGVQEPAVVQTVDFFTPIVDEPYDFGRIAATNALSDLYAMGATPAFALVIAAFPIARLPLSALKEMLRGVSDTARSAGIDILGGHTVDGSEPLLGLSATGFVSVDRVVRNRGGRPGDLLYLTKPLGTGILSTALKQNLLTPGETKELIQILTTLNDTAARAMTTAGVSAATDVTGFGLLGHLLEMLGVDSADREKSFEQSISAQLYANRIPFLPRAAELAASGVVPGGSRANLNWASSWTWFAESIPQAVRILLADAQTSGGLLIAVPSDRAETLEKEFLQVGCTYWQIGEFKERGTFAIEVV